MAEILDAGPGTGFIGSVDVEADELADSHTGDTGDAERGDGALDSGALRIGDPGTESDLDLH